MLYNKLGRTPWLDVTLKFHYYGNGFLGPLDAVTFALNHTNTCFN